MLICHHGFQTLVHLWARQKIREGEKSVVRFIHGKDPLDDLNLLLVVASLVLKRLELML